MTLDASAPGSLPPRPADGHKGTFGTILVIGGRDDPTSVMAGAPAFAALGSLRAGAGRAVLCVPRSLATVCLGLVPSATLVPRTTGAEAPDAGVATALAQADAVVIGPGLGASRGNEELLDASLATGRSVIVDADALTLVARRSERVRSARGPVILTPHPGEYRRLAETLGCPIGGPDPDSRRQAAGALAGALNAIVVLKGAGTVVADAERLWVCDRGSAALATAGTGDVLAGIIGALVATMPPELPVFEAVTLAVWIHAVAGERWAERRGPSGMLAAELAAEVPAIMSALR